MCNKLILSPSYAMLYVITTGENMERLEALGFSLWSALPQRPEWMGLEGLSSLWHRLTVTKLTPEQELAAADRIPPSVLEKAFKFLDAELAKEWEDDDYPFKGCHKACGTADVYIPPHLEVVIKRAFNTVEIQDRFRRDNYLYSSKGFPVRISNVRMLRKFAIKQDFRALVIPRIAPDRRWVTCEEGEVLNPEYLIEEKLPIVDGRINCVRFYLERHAQFNQAVKEMMVLLRRYNLIDIVGNIECPQASVARGKFGVGLSRFDNVCFINGSGEIKLGLVDLEAVLPGERKPNKYCRDIVTLFPLHIAPVLDWVREMHPKLTEDEYRELSVELGQVAENALKFYRHLYTDSVVMLEKNGVTLTTPWTKFSMPPELIKEFAKMLKDEAMGYLARAFKEEKIFSDQISTVKQAIDNSDIIGMTVDALVKDLNVRISRKKKYCNVSTVPQLIEGRTLLRGKYNACLGLGFHVHGGECTPEEKIFYDLYEEWNNFFCKGELKQFFSFHEDLLNNKRIYRQFLEFCQNKGLLVFREGPKHLEIVC